MHGEKGFTPIRLLPFPSQSQEQALELETQGQVYLLRIYSANKYRRLGGHEMRILNKFEKVCNGSGTCIL